MENAHEIFVEWEFTWEDGLVGKRKISIQDAIKSMSYERWVKPTLDKYGPAIKDLYLLLVYFPWWTQLQRDTYINEYKEQIIDAWETVVVDYIDNLYVTIPWTNQSYIADQFKAHRDYVAQQLQKELTQAI